MLRRFITEVTPMEDHILQVLFVSGSNVLLDMKNKGLLEEVDGFVRLTDRGIDVSNYVMSEFIL